MLKKVAFTMYPVQDAKRARDFYEHTLGLKVGLTVPNGMWTEFDLPGGGCLALFANDKLQPSASGACIAFEVEDLDALNVQLKDAGVTYKEDLIQSPVCRMSIILDTEGNSVILHQLSRKQ